MRPRGHSGPQAARRRKIITIGSGAGHAGSAGVSAYGCSKAGLWMLTRVLARELASSNIDVNELVPGPVATNILASQAAGAHLKSPSMGEEWFKTPEDLLPLAMFLATNLHAARPARALACCAVRCDRPA
jgi:3-oxoacyl-[acyl-carrier protein] reductase